METTRLGFFARLWLALWLPWKILFDGMTAARVEQAAEGQPLLPAEPERPRLEAVKPPAPLTPVEADPAPALHVLAILQRDGRFLDFLQEDLAAYDDAQVGAAARAVHEGCKKAIVPYVRLAPVRSEAEGATVTIEAGFDPAKVRLTGNVVGTPPFRGRLAHPGWRAAEVKLPPLPPGADPTILAPAEVEL
jgi:hypothetical protein